MKFLNMMIIVLLCGAAFAQAPPIELPQIVLTAKHVETVGPIGATSTTQVVAVRSSNPGVATVRPYRANQVQIVAVAPGRTTVEFFDSSAGQQYSVQVMVEPANATGGGGAGYDPTKTQIPQIVTQIGRTENVAVPGSGRHHLSGIVSSNPSVATARTNTQNTIQVYAKALGDTFVDFRDNASGTTYQVHVWVTLDGVLPPVGPTVGGPTLTMPPGDEDSIEPPPIATKVDPCVVGTWVSESLDNESSSGGAGAIIKIDKMGKVVADYSGMSALLLQYGGSRTVKGRTVVYVGTSPTGFRRVAIIRGDAISLIFNANAPPTEVPITDGGPAVPSNGPYKCSPEKLTSRKEVYKRISK